jgi:hypothetical protein
MEARRRYTKALALALAGGLAGCIRVESNAIADPRATPDTSGGMDSMTIMALAALAIFGVAFPALCLWLAVRLNKRGGRWARVTAACLLGLAIFVVGNIFGPVVWMFLLQALAIALVAFSIWLTVRIVNRRERWAKWTAVVLVALLVAYPLSFGPVCWLKSQPVTEKLRRPGLAMIVYIPLCRLASSNTVMGHVLMSWVHYGLGRERSLMLPTTVSDLGEWRYQAGPEDPGSPWP